MATQPSRPNAMRESCDDCQSETLHDIQVEIRTESKKDENSEFSREPYRVSTCTRCGAESAIRMNNA